jgi:hypothetical protein
VKQVREERAACMVDAATLILSLQAKVDALLQQASATLFKNGVTYAMIKSIEVVSKSLLARCLPYET